MASLPLNLGHPSGDDLGVGALVEYRLVLAEPPVTFADLFGECRSVGLFVGIGLAGSGQDLGGLFEVVLVEQRGEPPVEPGYHRLLFDVEVAGMLGLSDAVLVGEPAPVVGPVVVLLALHLPAADPAADETGEQVATAGGAAWGPSPPAFEGLLGFLEQVQVDDRLMGRLVGPDPRIRVVPAHLGLMSEADVVDVDEHLVAPLAVPYLAARVAGVGEDGPHRRFRPGASVAGSVPVAGGVVGGGRGDAFAGELCGDGVQPFAVDEILEDVLDDRGGGQGGCPRFL